MVLTDLWHTARHHLEGKQIAQIIKFAGQGKLLDDNQASQELRQYLSYVSTDVLEQYAHQCLERTFPDSGFALQDIMNQAGERLGLRVDYGAYRSGADGIWHFPDQGSLVIEVKTSDAFRFDMAILAEYRDALISQGKVGSDDTSILLVVGREDTGGIESQIRGSRFAWDIRLISVEAVMQLVRLVESTNNPNTNALVCDVLTPQEYIRLDNLIRLMFTNTTALPGEPTESLQANIYWKASIPSSKARPVSFYSAVKERIEDHLDLFLVRRNRSSYSTPDEISTATVILVSRLHEQGGYWFALHPHQLEFLNDALEGYLALGCGSPSNVLLIPLNTVQNWLGFLSQTQRNNQPIWHLNVIVKADGELCLMTLREHDNIPLDEFHVS